MIKSNAHIVDKLPTKSEFDMKICCRTCLKTDGSLFSLKAEDEVDDVKISYKLTSCISDIVWLGDNLPKFICTECLKLLRISFDFRKACISSNETIQKLLEKPIVPEPQKVCKQIVKTEHSYSANEEVLLFNDVLDEEVEEEKYQITEDGLPYVENAQNSQQHKALCKTTNSTTRAKTNIKQIINKVKNGVQDPRTVVEPSHDADHIPKRPLDSRKCSHFARGKLTRHMNYEKSNKNDQTHKASGKPFACGKCDEKFFLLSYLTLHNMKHYNEEGALPCDFCDVMFHTSSELMIHKRLHFQEKPHACTMCSNRFVTSGELTYHVIETHTGTPSLKCKFCSETFVLASELKFHMQTHAAKNGKCKDMTTAPTCLDKQDVNIDDGQDFSPKQSKQQRKKQKTL